MATFSPLSTFANKVLLGQLYPFVYMLFGSVAAFVLQGHSREVAYS